MLVLVQSLALTGGMPLTLKKTSHEFEGVLNLAFKTKTSRIHHGESKWHNSQKGGFVRGHDKPIPGSCDIYFPGGRNAKDNIISWSSKKR